MTEFTDRDENHKGHEITQHGAGDEMIFWCEDCGVEIERDDDMLADLGHYHDDHAQAAAWQNEANWWENMSHRVDTADRRSHYYRDMTRLRDRLNAARRSLKVAEHEARYETRRADNAEKARDDYASKLEDVRGRLEFRKSELEVANAEAKRLREALREIVETSGGFLDAWQIAHQAIDPDRDDLARYGVTQAEVDEWNANARLTRQNKDQSESGDA